MIVRNVSLVAAAGALAASFIVVVAAAGCGSSTESLCVQDAKARCHLEYACCTAVERDQFFGQENLTFGPYSDEGGCVDAFTRVCQEVSQAQDEEIAAKRLTFDSARAQKCADDLSKAADQCEAGAFLQNEDDNCARLTQGNVDDGGKCTSDRECKNLGSHCQVDQVANGQPGATPTITVTVEGTCKGQGDAGEPCFPGNQCKPGLRCVLDDTTGTQACQPPGAAGATCQQDADCQSGLRCAQDATFTNKCTAPGDVDSPCSQNTDCKAGLECVQNVSQQLVCAVPGVAGVQCSSNDDCGANLICSQSQTDFRQRCTAVANAGDPCPDGVTDCAPGLACVEDQTTFTNICVAGAAGDPCDSSTRCQSGLACRTDPIAGVNKCQAPLQANQACQTFDTSPPDCASNLVCRQNASFQDVCQAPIAASQPCGNPSSSEVDPCDGTHHCVFDAASSQNTCQPRTAPGGQCFGGNNECTAGTFCDEFNTGTCTALKSSGATCDQSVRGECAAGLTCRENDANSGTVCRPPSTEGQGCSQLADCDVGLDCRSDDTGARSVCRGPSSENGRCDSPADCGAGLDCRLADDSFSSTVCRSPSSEGGKCARDFDCAQGLTCKNDPQNGQLACFGPAVAGDVCAQDSDCDNDLLCRQDPTTGQFKCRALGAKNDACTGDQDCTAGLRCRALTDTSTSEVCTDLLDDGSECQKDGDCLHGRCDPNSNQCGAAPPKTDFEICNGI